MDISSLPQQMFRRPLCSSYVSVHLSTLAAAVLCTCTSTTCTLTWGVGVTSDGGLDVLGTWAAGGHRATRDQWIVVDLLERGVKRVDYLVASSASEFVVPVSEGRTAASTPTPTFTSAQRPHPPAAAPREQRTVIARTARLRRVSPLMQAQDVPDGIANSS